MRIVREAGVDGHDAERLVRRVIEAMVARKRGSRPAPVPEPTEEEKPEDPPSSPTVPETVPAAKTKQPELPLIYMPFAEPSVPVSLVGPWGRQCFFPPKAVAGGWKIVTPDGWEFSVGDQSTLLGDKRESKSWDIRHGVALLALLQVTANDRSDGWLIFRLREFVERMWPGRKPGSRPGGDDYRRAGNLILDFRKFLVLVRRPDGRKGEFHVVAERRVEIIRRDKVCYIRFDSEFKKFQDEIEKVPVRLDKIAGIKSDLAQSLAIFLGSRAAHHGPGLKHPKPWEIKLATLLKQTGVRDPGSKSDRKEIFTRKQKGAPSVRDQLNDGVLLADGRRKLVVALKETADGTDWVLLVWSEIDAAGTQAAQVEQRKNREIVRIGRKSLAGMTPDEKDRWQNRKKLKQAWIDGNGEPSAYHSLLRERKIPAGSAFESYAQTTCADAGVKFDRIRKLAKLAAALVGSGRIEKVVAAVKGDVLERRGLKNPGSVLVHRILECVRERAAPESEKWSKREAEIIAGQREKRR